MKIRQLSKKVIQAARSFPAVVITGPRQSGKTTLVRDLFKKTHAYVNLEDPDTRARALADPRLFFASFNSPRLILDEIQYTPELLSYVKSAIDEHRTPGRFIITGSQQFSLMQGVSESLAGRAAILTLLPFSYGEKIGKGSALRSVTDWTSMLHNPLKTFVRTHPSIASLLIRGSYPTPTRPSVDYSLWYGSYLATYLERDIRNLSQVGDLQQFEHFLRLLASRTGQILDLAGLARDLGISQPTAKRWLSILETGYQVLLLYPYFRNIGKRVVKRPKVFITDTGLACYLLGINDPKILVNHPQFGSLFETFVIADVWKRSLHSGLIPSLYYFRSHDDLEVDLVIEEGEGLHCVEIKSSMTVKPQHAASLVRFTRTPTIVSRVQSSSVISLSTTGPISEGIMNYHWSDIFSI